MKIWHSRKIPNNIGQNMIIFTSLIIIFSAIIYYLYALNLLGVLLTIILSIISLIILNKYNLIEPAEKTYNSPLVISNLKQLLLKERLIILAYVAFLLASGLELYFGRSDSAFISPWEKVSSVFFYFYFLSSLTLIIAVLNKNISQPIKIFLISSHYCLSLAVAVVVYKIGYGFDPFIHQAAMEIIDKAGVVLPKTPYYLGEYGLIISIHKIFGIPIYILNKLLVLLMATVLIPSLISKLFQVITKNIKEDNYSFLGTVIILALSFPLFIISTPQNLSYIFIIAAIISGLIYKNPTTAIIFALTTTAIHPLSGIPAIIWSIWLVAKYYKSKTSKFTGRIISTVLIFVNTIFIPLALFIASGGKIENINLGLNIIISQIKSIFIFSSAGSESWLLNLTYFLSHNNKLLILLLIIIGVVLFYKKNKYNFSQEEIWPWKGLLAMGLSSIAAFILSSQISFQQIINYEQSDYANRLMTIAVIFLSPFIILTIREFTAKISELPERSLKLFWLILIAIFITISLYLAYPRFDRYFNSRGYSTSRFDLEAVKKIDEQTNNNYVVLANQQVSIAALQLLGFNHYYQTPQGLIYFYPIPTGGRLYQYYLDIVYKNPNRETMLKAMDLVEVNEAYLIINKYWNESTKIINAAKLTADNWETVGGQEIFIFKYTR
jgi:hypothetical protein